jgi:hypothetical protein
LAAAELQSDACTATPVLILEIYSSVEFGERRNMHILRNSEEATDINSGSIFQTVYVAIVRIEQAIVVLEIDVGRMCVRTGFLGVGEVS